MKVRHEVSNTALVKILTVEQIRPGLKGQEEREMRKQIARGLTMLMLVVGLAFASAAVANGQSRQLTANVPFDFVVADKTLQSGQYRVRKEGIAGEVITVRSADEKDHLY